MKTLFFLILFLSCCSLFSQNASIDTTKKQANPLLDQTINNPIVSPIPNQVTTPEPMPSLEDQGYEKRIINGKTIYSRIRTYNSSKMEVQEVFIPN